MHWSPNKYICGLCGSGNKDLESLNLHLTTCERYKCKGCDNKFANLTEVRSHIEDKHLEESYLTIMHIKQNRVDSEVIDEKKHYAQEMFPILIRKLKFSNTKFSIQVLYLQNLYSNL